MTTSRRTTLLLLALAACLAAAVGIRPAITAASANAPTTIHQQEAAPPTAPFVGPPGPAQAPVDQPQAAAPRPEKCLDPGTCVAGRGLLVLNTDAGLDLYKDEKGTVEIDEMPSELDDTSFVTYDAYPDYEPGDGYTDNKDSRTDEVIEAVQTDTSGTVTIALPAADLAGDGWARAGTGDGADFYLKGGGRDANDPELAYWLYEREAAAETWIDVPAVPSGERPPFVFAPKDTLTFANPLPLPNGVVIDTSSLVSNPTMTIVPGEFDADGDGQGDGDVDGDGTAENDVYLANVSGVPQWKVWRSLDAGQTWERWAKPSVNLNRQTLFWHDGAVYLMGWLKHPEDVPDENARAGVIYRSTDGGQTFPDYTTLPFDAGDAPSNVQIADGRIWKAAYGKDADGNRGSSLISAPVDADLMDADSWTAAVGQSSDEWRRSDVEGTTVLMRDGRVASVAPVGNGKMTVVYSDGPTRTTFDPETDEIDLSHNGKFSMQYDEESDRYWTLVNGPNGQPRNVLNLFSSSDLETWELEKEVLRGPSSRFHGFQYANMLIEGDDIIFVSRTAFENRGEGNSDRWHNGNMFTFHRVEDFRSLS